MAGSFHVIKQKKYLKFVKKIKIRVNILKNLSDIKIENVTYMDVTHTRT